MSEALFLPTTVRTGLTNAPKAHARGAFRYVSTGVGPAPSRRFSIARSVGGGSLWIDGHVRQFGPRKPNGARERIRRRVTVFM